MFIRESTLTMSIYLFICLYARKERMRMSRAVLYILMFSNRHIKSSALIDRITPHFIETKGKHFDFQCLNNVKLEKLK